MKKLILIRHAKSDWGNESLKDIDRPLNDRGYEDAYTMGEWYKGNLPVPDAMLASNAIRAVSTAFIFARILGKKEAPIKIEEDLYESTISQWLKVISSLESKQNVVTIFGHNPVITNLANEFNKDLFFDNIPTCGIVALEFAQGSWKDIIEKKEGKLLMYKFPKSFKQ